MKLLNHTALYLSGSLFFIIGIWAVLFYFSMLDEVYDSIDDSLDNYKMLIIQKAEKDSTVLYKTSFNESNYSVHHIDEQAALERKETYKDTLMYMQNEEDFEPVRLLTTVFKTKHGAYYELKIIASMVEEDDLIADLTYALVWLYAIIIISVVIINNVVLKRIWKPFYALITQLGNFNLSRHRSFDPPQTKVEEFKTLTAALVNLLEKNIEVYESQKQFIENASHELQTPIAISTGKLELMLEDPDLKEEQAKNLSDVLQTLERLARLNKSLLLLSKIENKQFPEQEPVDFNSLIKHQCDEFSQLLEFRQMNVVIREEGVFKTDTNKDLALILVSNLLKNAIVHSPRGTELSVVISSANLKISNEGSGALDPEKLFLRFYKNSEKKGSTGLGLAIAKTIADLYNLNLSYSFDGKHNFVLQM